MVHRGLSELLFAVIFLWQFTCLYLTSSSTGSVPPFFYPFHPFASWPLLVAVFISVTAPSPECLVFTEGFTTLLPSLCSIPELVAAKFIILGPNLFGGFVAPLPPPCTEVLGTPRN